MARPPIKWTKDNVIFVIGEESDRILEHFGELNKHLSILAMLYGHGTAAIVSSFIEEQLAKNRGCFEEELKHQEERKIYGKSILQTVVLKETHEPPFLPSEDPLRANSLQKCGSGNLGDSGSD